jgi:hypothetical protein
MLRTGLTYFIVFLLISLLTGCIQESEPPVNKAIQGSNEVLNIPVKRRWKELNEGNKVFNSSFEQGRVFNNNFHTFEINGWSKIGNNIAWVDTDDKEFSRSDVSSGKHAVKIINKSRSETGEDKTGILSDYIKVLNGNYRLSFDVKLKDICPYNSRFGSRLIDAVNIRMYYYDKNKIRLDGKIYDPEQKKFIDNEFKALPFSGFWKIDSLGWIRSNGVTCKFPFPDGDVPKETKYVRIFFGLKGSGTMWVDNVNLTYTRQNFSVKEYLEPYKDSVFSKTNLILPTPKQIMPGKKIALFSSAENKALNPLIVTPSEPGPQTRKAVKHLENQLLQILNEKHPGEKRQIAIKQDVSSKNLKDWSIIFSVGNNMLNNSLDIQDLNDSIRNHRDGYFIKKVRSAVNNNAPIICIKGSSQRGDYYAAQTVSQLFNETSAEYHHADIIDYPDFINRGIICRDESGFFREEEELIKRYRFTHVYATLNGKKSIAQVNESLENLSLSAKSKNNVVKQGLSINPYKIFSGKKSHLEQANIPYYKDVIKLLEKAQTYGINDYIIDIDNTFSIKDSCLCVFHYESDGNHLKYRSLLDVHKDMINEIADNLNIDAQISFLPLWNNTRCIRKSQGKGELYLNELFRKIPQKVNYLWTGASTTPYLVDETEILYIRNITGKKPVFYCKDIHPFSDAAEENAYSQNFPGKLRNTSIFQQLNLHTPVNFRDITAESSFIAEIEHNNSLDDIKLACFADYLWNNNTYDPNLSLLKVLISNYGKKEAFALIKFNDLYKGLQEMLIKMNKLESRRKYVRTAEDIVNRLNKHMKTLEGLLEGTAILKDIQKMDKELRQQFEHMIG